MITMFEYVCPKFYNDFVPTVHLNMHTHANSLIFSFHLFSFRKCWSMNQVRGYQPRCLSLIRILMVSANKDHRRSLSEAVINACFNSLYFTQFCVNQCFQPIYCKIGFFDLLRLSRSINIALRVVFLLSDLYPERRGQIMSWQFKGSLS